MYGTTGWRVASPLGKALCLCRCQSRIIVTCHSVKIIASSKSKIACILYKFFPRQNKNYWKDPPKIPCMWEPEYILAQLIHSYPVCNFPSFKSKKQVPAKGFSPSIGFVLAPGAVDFCSAVRLWVTRIIFALRARKEQIFYQHLNHLSSAREEGLIAQLHTHKLMRTRRGASGGIFYLCRLDLLIPAPYPLQRDLSVKIPNPTAAATPHPRVTAQVPPCCLFYFQMWKPGLGLGKVGYFCGYFMGGEGLPCCYVCFYSRILHH